MTFLEKLKEDAEAKKLLDSLSEPLSPYLNELDALRIEDFPLDSLESIGDALQYVM